LSEEEKEFLTIEHAMKIFDKPNLVEADRDEVVIDDHRWIHVWVANKPSSLVDQLKEKGYSLEQGLRKLHEIYVNELRRRHYDHESPLKFQTPILHELQKGLREFMWRRGGVQWVGSAVKGKADPGDLDVVIRLNEPDDLFLSTFKSLIPEKWQPSIEGIWDARGSHGPYIEAGDFIFRPSKGDFKIEMPDYRIKFGEAILPLYPGETIKFEDVRVLPDIGWIVEDKLPGIRLMIQRDFDNFTSNDKEGDDYDVSEEIKKDLMGIKDPPKFILDGWWMETENKFYISDMLWWRETELVQISSANRKGFLAKFPSSERTVKTRDRWCLDGEEIEDYIKSLNPKEGQEFFIKQADSEYSLNGVSPQWYFVEIGPQVIKAQAHSDERIKELVDSGKWEKMSATERFELMIKREKIEPLYPYAQVKTSKRGYQVREVFGIKPVTDLASAWFSVPNNVAVETKFDAFRVQIHKSGDQVKMFTESGVEVGHLLPNLTKDVKELKAKSVVLDSETVPYDEEGMSEGRRGAAKAFGGKEPIDDSRWVSHVFDILYLDGKDLHREGYEERREILKGLELPVSDVPKFPVKFHLQENLVDWASTAEMMVKLAMEHSKVKFSEGAMFKQAVSTHPLTGQTPLWAKMKKAFEIDAIVLGRKPKIYKAGPQKGKPVPGQWTYVGGCGPISKPAEAEPVIKEAPIEESSQADYVKVKGKLYAVLGDTFSTDEDMDVGDIVRVNVDKVRKISATRYHWLIPKVIEPHPEKTHADPLSVAQEIARETFEPAKVKVKAAFPLETRMGAESLISEGRFPTKFLGIYSGDDWHYAVIKGQEGIKEFMDKYEAKTFYARTISWSLHEFLEEEGVQVVFTDSETTRQVLDLYTYIFEEQPLIKAEFLLWDLQRFYSENPDPDVLLFQASEYLTMPAEDQTWRFVAQAHVRGLSVHIDIRFEIVRGQRLVGWTMDALKSLIKPMLLRYVEDSELSKYGLTKARVREMTIKEVSQQLTKTTEGKKLYDELSIRVEKLDDKTVKSMVNDLVRTELMPILETPERKILLQTKAPEPHEWLTYEGRVSPGEVGATAERSGRFFIVDKGTIEFGAQKPYYHEYWLHGKIFRDLHLIIRRLPTAPKWELKAAFAWMGFFALPEKLPYTITTRAIEKVYMPPIGKSALPREIRNQIPEAYRYWTKKDGGEAKRTRDLLVRAIKKKEIKLKYAQGLKFALKRFWYRGPVHIRGAPNVFYYLIFHDGKKVVRSWDFGEEGPLELQPIATARVGKTRDNVMIQKTAELGPKHILNPTEELPLHMDTVDEGSIQLITDSTNFLRFRMGGKRFSGLYVLYREDPRSTEWFFKKAELPHPIKKALFGTYAGLMTVPSEKMEVKQIEDLLVISGPFLRPGEMIGLDMRPSFFPPESVDIVGPTMAGQPIVVMHGDLKGDVVGYVQKVSVKDHVAHCDIGIIWHPKAIRLITEKVLPDFSIELLPRSVWDAENQREVVLGGQCVGLGVVTKGAGKDLHIERAVLVSPAIGETKQVFRLSKKFGMPLKEYLTMRYWRQDASTVDLAEEFQVSETAVKKMFSELEIETRTLEEAAETRRLKEWNVKRFGGAVTITFLGTGCEEPIPRENCDCPQCKEALKGGRSRRNHSSLLITYGGQNLILDAPEEIVEMLGLRKITPEFLLVTHAHPDHAAGLKFLTKPNLFVFATEKTWAGVDKAMEYPFKKKVVKSRSKFRIGEFIIEPFSVAHSTIAPAVSYKITIGSRTLVYAPDMLEIQNRKAVLKDVDIYVGDGSSLNKTIVRTDKEGRRVGHASMAEQIKWCRDEEIPEVLFTHIGHLQMTYKDLNAKLQELAPNSMAMYDGASFMMKDENPGHKLPEGHARMLWEGKKRMIVSTKPYMKYATKVIFFVDEDKVYGRMVEGFPEGPFDADQVRERWRKFHKITDDQWKRWFKDAKKVFIFRPRIITKFETPLDYKPEKGQQVYIANVKIIPRAEKK